MNEQLRRELTSYPRSFQELALAFQRATDAVDENENEATAAAKLTRALASYEMAIDTLAIQATLSGLIALVAARQRTTPRQVIDDLWKDAPDDAWWRDRIDEILEGDQ